jgi:hypothetical protein
MSKHYVNPALVQPGHDLVIATKSLMRGLILQARAVVALCDAGMDWPAGSNLRSMFESHLDISLMLAGPHPERNARRVALHAMKDMAESSFDRSPHSPLKATVASFAKTDPDAYREFEKIWGGKRPPPHWSGKSRKAQMDELEPDSEELRRGSRDAPKGP